MSALSTQVQFAIRSTQQQRLDTPALENCDSGVTAAFVERFSAQEENGDVAALAGRSLQRPTLAPKLERYVVDSIRKSDGVAHRAALLAAGHILSHPGLAGGLATPQILDHPSLAGGLSAGKVRQHPSLVGGLQVAGQQVNRLVDVNFAGHPEADAIKVGASHRFLEGLRDAGDPAAAVALQMTSLPSAAAVATSLFEVGGAHTATRQRTASDTTEYLSQVGGRAIDTVFGYEGSGSGKKVEIASAFITALAKDSTVAAHAKVVGDLMQSETHERIKTLLGRTAMEAFQQVGPDATTEEVLARAGMELYGAAGVRASSCDLDRDNYATAVPKRDDSKQLGAAKAIARWMAEHGRDDVRALAAMTADTDSLHIEHLEAPYQALFQTVLEHHAAQG